MPGRRVHLYRGRRWDAHLRLFTRALALALWALALPAAAQTPTDPSIPLNLPAALREQPGGSAVPLEGVVDVNAYTVGPGDVFAFSIGGRIPFEQRAVVTADGMLIVPEVGSFRVAGRSLAAVRAELRAALRRRYTNVETDAALATPRRFVVHVAGAVASPGRHAVVPVARLEDALAEAMGESPLVALRRQQAEDVAVLPALRNVRIRHADGAEESVDLLRYYATGDTRSNPYLLDGDVVHVPFYTRRQRAVFVEDRYSAPQVYDYRDGDTVADLLVVARGQGAESAAGAVRLLRVQADGEVTVQTLDAADLARGAAREVPLQPLDRIRLVEPNAEAAQATAAGAVRFSGVYPIIAGETTLRQLVEMAGGLEPEALARGAYLERRGPPQPAALEEVRYREALSEVEPAERTAFLEDEAYVAGRLSGLPFESRQFLMRELLAFQRISLDLPAVLAGRAEDVPLRDGDRLVVPSDFGGVLVVGQVQRPGLIPFRPGADAEAYVAEAGGRGPASTEVYLRDASSGALIPARGAEVRSGDVLFVDRVAMAFSEPQQSLLLQRQQVEAQIRRDRSESRTRLLQTVLSILGTGVSALSLYIVISQNN